MKCWLYEYIEWSLQVFKQYEDILQTIYIRYADQKIPGKKKDPKLMNLQNWLQFLKDAVLLDKPYVGLEVGPPACGTNAISYKQYELLEVYGATWAAM